MNIKVEEIRLLLNKALDHYQLLHKEDTITISEDYYWLVSDNDMFNFAESPDKFQLGVGSFYDEIPQLLESLNKDEIVDSNHLQYLAFILKYMSDRILHE